MPQVKCLQSIAQAMRLHAGCAAARIGTNNHSSHFKRQSQAGEPAPRHTATAAMQGLNGVPASQTPAQMLVRGLPAGAARPCARAPPPAALHASAGAWSAAAAPPRARLQDSIQRCLQGTLTAIQYDKRRPKRLACIFSHACARRVQNGHSSASCSPAGQKLHMTPGQAIMLGHWWKHGGCVRAGALSA